jgi:predicted membrane protein
MTDDYPPAPTPEPAPAADPVPPGNGDAAHRLSLGQVVTGAILVMIGIAWLFEAADWADIPWRGLLAGALIVVGVALMLGARRGSHGGLIAFGVILAVVMAVSSAIEVLADIPLSGGIGEQQHRPVVQVDDEYRWGIGSMKLDLRDVETELEGLTIEASVGIGELVVYVPGEVAVDVDARSGIGEVDIFGQKSAGLGSDLHVADEADPRLVLDLDVAIGKVEVRR